MSIKNLLLAAVVVTTPAVASAATVNGQLDIVGSISPLSKFSESGFFVDFVGVGRAQIATGDFEPYIIDLDEVGVPTTFTLFDIVGTSPAVIYSGGGFTFTATSFSDFVAAPLTPRGFQANGLLTGNGFDATPALFAFSTQSTGRETVLRVSFSSETIAVPLEPPAPIPLPASMTLLGAAVAGLCALRRRRRSADC